MMIWKLSVVVVIVIFSILVSTLISYKKSPNNSHGSKSSKHIPTENDIHCSYMHDTTLMLQIVVRLAGKYICVAQDTRPLSLLMSYWNVLDENIAMSLTRTIYYERERERERKRERERERELASRCTLKRVCG
jgi:hypothetical protein